MATATKAGVTEMHISEFIEANSLTMEATPSPANPNMDDMPKGSYHFHIAITGPHGALMTYYSVGPGVVTRGIEDSPKWRELCMRAQYLDDNGVWKQTGKTPSFARIDSLKVLASDALVKEAMRVIIPKYHPDIADVLDCLAMDASTVDQSPIFEDWAGDFGYGTDSIKARRSFDACLLQAAQLRKVLGRDAYHVLTEEVERL